MNDDLERTLARVALDHGYAVSTARFVAHVAGLRRRDVALHTADLYLAFACLEGDGRATRDFCSRYREQIGRSCRSRAGRVVDVPELEQAILLAFVVGDRDRPPKLRQYRGEGPLRRFVRAAATRAALNRIRDDRRRRETALRSRHGRAVLPCSPVDAAARIRYGPQLRAAFARAFEALGDRDRNVLRYAVVGGLSPDRIARIYGVHRTTIVRWSAAARLTVAQRTRDELVRHLSIEPAAAESLARLLRSDPEVSIARLLAPAGLSPG